MPLPVVAPLIRKSLVWLYVVVVLGLTFSPFLSIYLSNPYLNAPWVYYSEKDREEKMDSFNEMIYYSYDAVNDG